MENEKIRHDEGVTGASAVITKDFRESVERELVFLSELCWGTVVVAYTKPQQKKKAESERLRGERDQIEFVDLRFERWQVVRFRKARRRQDAP